MKILHIMPHLGGGVGKALSTLVAQFTDKDYCHSFLLLELPEKSQFLDKIRELGCEVHVKPNNETVNRLINNTDIVQLEWWNHPATFQFLCTHDFPEMRLLVWCHVSGLHVPIIPKKLIGLSTYFLFTSACSYKAESIINLDERNKLKLDVVSSGVGFTLGKKIKFESQTQLRYGYMGSLNPSKLHPKFINYLSAVSLSEFKVSIWGDDSYKNILLSQCKVAGNRSLIDFKGYTIDPATMLASLDIFIYLLNPIHYGTAENVLLEAMSLGLVPIVLNNPAEVEIVEHGETGLVVNNQKEFIEAINWLENNPKDRRRISRNASTKIAEKYSAKTMFQTMRSYYDQSFSCSKSTVDFRSALGNNPYDWYRACREKENIKFVEVDNGVRNDEYEETKGSLNHYLSYFSNDVRLNKIADSLINEL